MHHLVLLAGDAATSALRLADPVPEAKDVKAGWTAFAIFLLLLAAVVVLAFSMAKQFRKAQRSREAGILPTQHDRDARGNRVRNSGDA
ncbi:MAG: hypothetical protein QM572_01670 [Nocardioides sp.]|uniref:hypothetical protein n=1 Tax=Nocardioides sp. TaxID=35761 RepID=UPI0039E23382